MSKNLPKKWHREDMPAHILLFIRARIDSPATKQFAILLGNLPTQA
jgi:hypothetical protein